VANIDQCSEMLSQAYAGAVFDAMRELGEVDCVLPHEITGVLPDRKIVGPAFTVMGHKEKGLDEHETLLRWTEFLSKAPPDHVVVCQPHDHTIAHMGELSAETLQLRGIKGYVVDGGSRDTGFIKSIGFPVFCRYLTCRDVVGSWVPDAFDQPVEIGQVKIEPGDFIFGDIDGVLRIPRHLVSQVADRVIEVMNTENLVRKAILSGTDPQEAYLKYGLF